MSSGFAHLNLRWNPFGEPDPSERPDLVVGNVSHWVDRLRRPGVAIQFVGEHGRGKSSRLLALHRNGRFPYYRAGRQVVPIHSGTLLIDEAQQLTWGRRWRVFRACSALALTTHADLSSQLIKAGFTVETVSVCGASAETVAAIFERRLAWARKGDGPLPHVPQQTIEHLLHRFGDDIRGMEACLYDCVQDMTAIGPIIL